MAQALNPSWLVSAFAVVVVAGFAAAWAMWLGSMVVRLGVAVVLVGAAFAYPAAHGSAPMIVALPALAALRRAPAGMVCEAIMAGCGWIRLTLRLLYVAAPGLASGALLCLLPERVPALAAAALPLLVQGAFTRRRGARPSLPVQTGL